MGDIIQQVQQGRRAIGAIMGKDQKIRHPRRAVMRDPFKAIGPFVAHAGYGKDTCHGRAVPWVRVAKVG